MKQCPKCSRVYADDALNFCLDDGDALVNAVVESETKTAILSGAPVMPACGSLSSISDSTHGDSGSHQKNFQEKAGGRKLAWTTLLVITAAVLIPSLSVGYILGRRNVASAPPSFHQLTFNRGTVWSARFAPDNKSIVYGAAFEGNPIQIYSARPESPESTQLGLPNGSVLAVSSTGELAVSLDAVPSGSFTTGTLSRVPLTGGAPRKVLEGVAFADWSPDGKNLAVVHRVGAVWRLEFPVGNVLYESTGHITSMRISPKGNKIAFMDHSQPVDDRGTVAVVDLQGKRQTLTQEAGSEQGLAWSPDGDEVWFSATTQENHRCLQSVTLDGKQRVLLAAPGDLTLQDVSPDGRVLLTRWSYSSRILGIASGDTKERDLSWLEGSYVNDVSADGKTILFTEGGASVGERYGVYLRQTDGSPAVRLGDGISYSVSISPDGKWVISGLPKNPSPLFLLPTGPGESRQLTNDDLHHLSAQWFPDGKQILFAATEPGHDRRSYVLDLATNATRPLTPEGTTACCVSPDGRYVITRSPNGQRSLLSFDSGESRELPGVAPNETIIRWSVNGQALLVFLRNEMTAKVFRVDVATGRRELWKELVPPDTSGNSGVNSVAVTPDERTYFYSFARDLSDLYTVEGIK